MVKDTTSATASQSGDDIEIQDEELKQELKAREIKGVVERSDLVQEDIVDEVQDDLGTGKVGDILEQHEGLDPGHIDDVYDHQEENFGHVEGDGAAGVMAIKKGDVKIENDAGELMKKLDDADVNDDGVTMLDQSIEDGAQTFVQNEKDERRLGAQNDQSDGEGLEAEDNVEYI